jgi:hypothetical protein
MREMCSPEDCGTTVGVRLWSTGPLRKTLGALMTRNEDVYTGNDATNVSARLRQLC